MSFEGNCVAEELRQRLQWCVWMSERKAGQSKLAKVPYYTVGGRRQGKQGSDEDRRRLVNYEAAVKAAPNGGGGIGFAFLPDDGLIGIDLDNVIDLATGEISERAREIIKACNSYTEYSPSGKGVHIYVLGDTAPLFGKRRCFKRNEIGIEVFCGSQFFTVTGRHFPGTPCTVNPIDEKVLRRLVVTVKGTKDKPPASSPPSARRENDFARVNDAAIANLDAWVPALFPSAKRTTQGWRVAQKDLGRELQEDLSITDDGIVDWGVADQGDSREGRRTPIDLVMEWSSSAKTPKDALGWLAGKIGITLKRSAGLARREARASAKHSEENLSPNAPIDWQAFFSRFVLIYPTETAWDAKLGEIVKVSAMKLAFGKGVVQHWLDSPDRRTVNAENVVFDPAQKCDPAVSVNLFRGLTFKPSPRGSCSKLLELLQYLCGEADQDQAPVTEFVLRWIAYPLRHIGSKMQTAIVMYGPEGTGKNLFWGAVNKLYEPYGTVITQFQLQSQFNDWASRKMFVIANEVVTRMELRHLVGYLKTLVTEPCIPIETKNMPVRVEDNHMQLVFLSNELRPLHLAPGDRRYMVIRTPRERDAAYYVEVAAEIAAGGCARLYDHLLHDIDLGTFDEHTKPITTQAKSDLIELGLSSTQLFWHELHEGLLSLPYVPCLSQDLYEGYLAWCARNGEKTPMRINQFSHEFMSMNGVARRVAGVL